MSEKKESKASFVSWNNEGDKSEALAASASAIEAYDGIMSSTASKRSFIDIEPNISVRNGMGREDYYRFRPDESIPQYQKEVIRMCMSAYDKVGIIKNVIDLMGDFAAQGVSLVHPNRKIERFYKRWFEKVNGKERSERFLNILYRCGNVVVSRRMARINSKTQDKLSRAAEIKPEDVFSVNREIPWIYDFLNPLNIEVIGQEFALFTGQKLKYALRVSTMIKRMAKNVSNQHQGMIAGLPKDIAAAIQSGQNLIELDPNKTSAYFYKKDDWKLWSNPMVYAILDDIVMLEKMKLADMSALDGAISNIRLWKLGDLDHKILPTKAGVNKLRNILASNVGGGTMDLVWGPEIDFKESNTQVYKFLGSEKYEPVLSSIFAGLGIPPTLTGAVGGGGGFTNNFVSLKTLIERLEYGRSILRTFWVEEIERVQKAMGFRKPAKIHFDHISLSDEAAEKNLLIQLADRDIISHETLQERFGEIPDIEKIRVSRESKERENNKVPPKAGPYHNPQHKNDIEKIALTKDALDTDSYLEEMGLPPSTKEQKEKLNPPSPNKFGQKEDKEFDPTGRPEDGRPKNSKDTEKRKRRSEKPRTGKSVSSDFVTLMLWATDAQKSISDIINPALLNHYGKKNARSLTKAQQSELEYVKLGILCNIKPHSNITAEQVYEVLTSGGNVIKEINDLCKEMIYEFTDKNSKRPMLDEVRQIQSSAYSMYHQNS